MQIRTVVAPLLATNCYVVSDGAGRCVVVDAGYGTTAQVVGMVGRHGLRPLAVLATHGHVDHTWSAGELCAAFDVPFLLHDDDRHRVADPFGTLGPLGAQLAATAASLGEAYRAPERIEGFTVGSDGDLSAAALDGRAGEEPFALRGLHVPGHTEGSTLYLCSVGDAGRSTPAALTGDVLFAGSVGRTDLPGGDQARMEDSLRRVAGLDGGTLVLPGHGPSSTIDAERRANPYLRMLG
ncbi:MAG: putative metallo-hydrolase [Actinotalea sp.]|nr:putative metallo-hydrolase [Actinotalea sp.]